MPWFWGSSDKNQDKEEDDESEYDSEEYTDEDEEEEDDESEIEDEEESIEKEDREDESLEASSSEENEDDEHDGNANNNPKENNEQDIRKDDENGEERPAESKPKDPELGKFILAAEDSATEQTSSPETSSEETTPLNNHIVNADDQDNDTKVPAPEAMDMPSLLDKDSPAVEAPTEETPKPAAAQEETVQQTDKKSNVIESRVEEEDSDDDDGELGELVLQGAIPGEVVGNRDRAPSALTHEEDENISRDETTDSADSEDYSDDDEDDEDEGEKETSLEEKQSLLILAAQYDRVDILNTVLTDATTNATKESDADQNAAVDEKEIKSALLHGGLPPLHVAILSGSMNAINCLLRVGADPSVRPDLSQISAEQLKTVKDAKLMDGVTAWELAFGNAENTNKKPKLNLPPSKQEGIQHAFSAEALRCIGSDEVDRLEQILNSGVPAELDMGGKSLYEWSSDMKAPKCQSLLRPEQDSASASAVPDKPEASAVLDRPSSSESVSSQINRLDELESLARALSSCLDNLAEEVSVCHGLLLMGNGASALATHVRSLKGNKEGKADELSRLLEAWENSEDELAYWVREAGDEGKKIAQQMAVIPNLEESAKQRFLGEDQDEEAQHRQLIAQIAASENKIRKLRVAITDLSEENTRDLAEVERRGLSGGINLVRGLKDEIRELEFQISEAKSGEAGCRAKTSMIQAKIASEKKRSEAPPIGGESEESPLAEERMEASIPAVPTTVNASQSHDKEEEEEEEEEEGEEEEEEEDEDEEEEEDEDEEEEEDEGEEEEKEPVVPLFEPPVKNAIADASQVGAEMDTDDEPAEEPASASRDLAISESTEEPKASAAVYRATSDGVVSSVDATRETEIGEQIVLAADEETNGQNAKPKDLESSPTDSKRITECQSTAIAVRGEGGRGYFTVGLWNILLRIIGVQNQQAASRSRHVQPVVII